MGRQYTEMYSVEQQTLHWPNPQKQSIYMFYMTIFYILFFN